MYQIKLDTPPLVLIVEKAETPYEVVSVDLTGPSAMLHGQVFLTMIDYYSHYPEAFILKRGDSKEILTCLRHVLHRMAFQPRLSVTMGRCFGLAVLLIIYSPFHSSAHFHSASPCSCSLRCSSFVNSEKKCASFTVPLL